METSRKKALEIMQKGLVAYQMIGEGWDVSDHFGDGCDLIAEKKSGFRKIELKAIDLKAIKKNGRATQSLSANEIVNSTHLIVSVFNGIFHDSTYIMTIRQFVENSGVKKFDDYESYEAFIEDYKIRSTLKSQQKKNTTGRQDRLNFDMNFDPKKIENWCLYGFKDKWDNLEL